VVSGGEVAELAGFYFKGMEMVGEGWWGFSFCDCAGRGGADIHVCHLDQSATIVEVKLSSS